MLGTEYNRSEHTWHSVALAQGPGARMEGGNEQAIVRYLELRANLLAGREMHCKRQTHLSHTQGTLPVTA